MLDHEFMRLAFGAGAVVGVLARRIGDLGRDQAGIGPDGLLDGRGDIGILLQEGLGVLTPLPDALAIIRVPGAGFLDDPV